MPRARRGFAAGTTVAAIVVGWATIWLVAAAQAAELRTKIAAFNATDGKLGESFKSEQDPTYPLHASTFLRVGLKPKEAKAPRSEKPDWTLNDSNTSAWRRHGNGLDGRFDVFGGVVGH
jgi:hypothetical protein